MMVRHLRGGPLWMFLSVFLVILFFGAQAWGGAEVVTVSGEAIQADAVTFEAGGGVRTRGPAGERRLEPDELVGVRLAHPLGIRKVRRGLVLVSGERFSGAVRELSAESALLRSPLLRELRFARREVAAVISGEGVSATDLLAAPTGEVVLRNGDRIQGQLQSIQGGVATLTTDLGKLDVAVERLVYIKLAQFPPSWGPVRRPLTALVLADGDWLLGDIVGEEEGKLLVHRAPAATGAGNRDARDAESGLDLSVPKSAVSEVRYLGRGVVYLSDLEPARVEEKPFFDYLLPWQRDLSVGKGRLSLRGQVFYKGLGVHARCRLTYDLMGKYARFHSVIGIDDEARGKGNCVFEVWVDGEKRFESGPVTGRDGPRTVEVDVTGADELVLLVGFGEAGDVADRADWADAYLVTVEAFRAARVVGKETP